jgi:hypothetical protein
MTETNKKEETSEPFTIDSGGGPKDGPFAGTGPLSDATELPKGAWEKIKV